MEAVYSSRTDAVVKRGEPIAARAPSRARSEQPQANHPFPEPKLFDRNGDGEFNLVDVVAPKTSASGKDDEATKANKSNEHGGVKIDLVV